MTTGVMTTNALKAADLLAGDGIDVSVVHFHTIKPLDAAAVIEHARTARLVVTIEEGIAIGGFGSAVTDLLVEELGPDMPHMKRIALPDSFCKNYGVQNDLFEIYGLSPGQIARTVIDKSWSFGRLADFGRRSDAWSMCRNFWMAVADYSQGQTVFLIVGSNSEIGSATARLIRRRGERVLSYHAAAGVRRRDAPRFQRARSKIRDSQGVTSGMYFRSRRSARCMRGRSGGIGSHQRRADDCFDGLARGERNLHAVSCPPIRFSTAILPM